MSEHTPDSFKSSSDSSNAPFVLLLIPLATIFLVYAYILFLSLRNFIRIRRNSQAIKFGKVFYFSIVLALVVRIVSFVLMVVGMMSYINNENSGKQDLNNLFTKSFLSLTYVPDIFVIFSFYIYGWLAFILFLLGLIQLPNSNIIHMSSKNGYFLVWLISLIGLEIVQAAGFFLYWFNDTFFPFEPYILLNSCANFIAAFMILACEAILHFSLAGVPFKADFHQKRFKRMNYILLFYAFGCVFKGAINIAQKGTLPILWQAIIEETTTPITSIIQPILLILQIFICEIVPILLVNDSKIIADLFVKREYNHIHHNHAYSTSLQSADRSLTENLIQNNTVSSVTGDEIVYGGQRLSGHKDSGDLEESVILDQKKVVVSNAEDPSQKEVLGLFYDALYNEDKIKARVIKVKKLTPYLTEEINREVGKYIRFRNPYVLKVRGCSLEETEVTIYYEYVERGNLHEILHLREKHAEKLDLVFKLKVAIQIAEGLKYLHTRDPKVIHGHLHPSNIWLDKDYVVKLTDYGFANLKKYASIMGKYSNITQYTAPEILAIRGKTAITDDPSADIYSFGMILWELLTEQVPFEDLDLKELQQLICKDNSRPKILSHVPGTLQNLIRACWQQDPQKRPKISQVIEMLGEELEQS